MAENVQAAHVRRLAEQGDATAQFNLGIVYANGNGVVRDHGVARDDTKAVEWLHKAAEQGHAAAQCNLGYMQHNGRGTLRDDAKALEWTRKSADQGYDDAQFNLGVFYEYGYVVDQNLVTALWWYKMAADQGYQKAAEAIDNIISKQKGQVLTLLLDQRLEIKRLGTHIKHQDAQIEHLRACPHDDYDTAMRDFQTACENGLYKR